MPSSVWRSSRSARGALLALLAGLAFATPAFAQRIRLSVPLPELMARAARDSCDSHALYQLAYGYVAHERWDAADSVLARAVALDPQLAVAFLGLAIVRERDERYWSRLRRDGGEAAVTRERDRRAGLFRKALLIDPFVDVRLMGVMYRERGFGNAFTMALRAFIDGDYNGAYALITSVLDYVRVPTRDSIPPGLLWYHALAGARANYHREAIADLEVLLRRAVARERGDTTYLTPLNTNEYRYMIAALRQRLRQNTLAIQMYEQVLEHDIGNYMAHVQLARIHEAEKGWFGAVRERRLAIEVNPEDHTLYFDLGMTLSNAGRWQEAEDPLRRAVTMEPRYFPAQRALGIALHELGRRDDARLALQHYVAIAPARDSLAMEAVRRRLADLGTGNPP